MGRMRREFEVWRRLRTFLPPEKPPSTAPLWEVMEGSAPDTNTDRRPLARHADGWQQIARSEHDLVPMGGATAGSMQVG